MVLVLALPCQCNRSLSATLARQPRRHECGRHAALALPKFLHVNVIGVQNDGPLNHMTERPGVHGLQMSPRALRILYDAFEIIVRKLGGVAPVPFKMGGQFFVHFLSQEFVVQLHPPNGSGDCMQQAIPITSCLQGHHLVWELT